MFQQSGILGNPDRDRRTAKPFAFPRECQTKRIFTRDCVKRPDKESRGAVALKMRERGLENGASFVWSRGEE